MALRATRWITCPKHGSFWYLGSKQNIVLNVWVNLSYLFITRNCYLQFSNFVWMYETEKQIFTGNVRKKNRAANHVHDIRTCKRSKEMSRMLHDHGHAERMWRARMVSAGRVTCGPDQCYVRHGLKGSKFYVQKYHRNSNNAHTITSTYFEVSD